ncbi:Uncharacterised protein [Kurthia zopfii]|uniref:Uncharacterized protein n=1 Tax=Kurthia zopfii TaxID=1650 RepID=A0A8B4Q5Q8_9BACL|nr:hypothetical protein [Kurthia zopfii]TDR31730.1 hypothetical protein DFR61_1727 [Kurthia zopfii]STX08609.1 Uncharacterised protein [Kurthia zopfii]
MSIILFVFGAIFLIWGTYRVKTDFKRDQKKNNWLSLLFSGQASGIGQILTSFR